MKILFYGFRHGHIIGLYKKAVESKRVEVVASIEDDKDAREKIEMDHGIVFDKEHSYEEWLEQDIDIVALGGTYGDRGPAAIKALKAGKHIILDKPICIKEEELAQMERIAKEKNLKIASMLDLRYLPAARRAKEILDSNELGEVKNVSFTGQHCLNYGTRPAWYFEKGKHGGTLNDLAIHGVDLIMDLTGLSFSKINAARVWNSFATQEPDFKDCGIFMAELENGAGVLCDVSYSAPTQVYLTSIYWNFKFWCEKGLLTFNINSPDVTVYDMAEKEPRVISGIVDNKNWLDDLLDEIERDTNEFTNSVIASSRKALEIQAKAEE